jgi:hypothetical protein
MDNIDSCLSSMRVIISKQLPWLLSAFRTILNCIACKTLTQRHETAAQVLQTNEGSGLRSCCIVSFVSCSSLVDTSVSWRACTDTGSFS